MTTRERRSFVNLVRFIRNRHGHETAWRVVHCAGYTAYWNYTTQSLTGVLLEDTRGRGVVIDL